MVIKIVLSIFLLYEVSNYNIKACEIKKSGLSAADKARLVDAHNRLRAKVANGQQDGQPSAANMKELVWDDALAAKAQEWTSECKPGHDTYEARKTSKYSVVGQNCYSYSSSGKGSDKKIEMSKPVQAWYNEVKDFDSNTVGSFIFKAKIAHYSQVVWAKTEAVGCGYITFQNGEWTKTSVCCNYGPGGNFKQEPVYLVGSPASKCDSKSTKYAGLCSS
uniref:Cysteine-rich venom protein n=1 Tax=Scolopendra subspinipes TaxID=55038 RepID=A0A5B9CTK6_SCOSU|nr:venom allergen [Scolopendra subspinipes]